MKFAFQMGLVLWVNLVVSSGGMIVVGPARSAIIGPVIAQAQPSDPLQKAIDEGTRLFKEGHKTSLKLAIEQFEQALKLSRAEGQNTQQGLALLALGRIYSSLDEKTKALEYYNQALPILRTVGNRSMEATTLSNIGDVYDTRGEKPKALEYYNQALPIWRLVGNRSGEAHTLSNIGGVYSARGDKRQALEYYNPALLIWRAVGDRFGEATALNNIGNVYNALGEKAKALAYFNQALPMRRDVGDRSGEAITLSNLGSVYSDLGEKAKALAYFNQALPMMRSVGDRSGEATTLNNMGSIYDALDEKTKALAYFNQALPISRAIGDRSVEATTLSNMGLVYDAVGKKTKALEYYSPALLIWRAVGARSGEATTLNNMGRVYDDLGEKARALESYNQALTILQTVGNRSMEATTLSNIGAIYDALGQKAKALEYYNQALPISRAVGDRSGEAITFSNLANLYRTQNKLPAALQNINATIQIVESIRGELKNDVLKTSYFSSVQHYYQFKTNILMQLHQQQPTQGYDAAALETADQSRARLLRELLIQASANIKKDISPDLLNQEQTLNQTLDAKEKQLVVLAGQVGKADQLPPLRAEIAALYNQRDDLKNTIRTTNPAYANLQYPKPTTLAQIQQQLDPDTLMLQYSLGDTESYLWVIGQTTLKTYILPKRSDLKKTVSTFRQELKDAKLPAPQSALDLSNQILTPAAKDLGPKRLVIIPDGILHTVPFSALNIPNRATYTPLITQHEITNRPSASTIGILRSTVANKPRGSKTLAILADPIFSKDDPRLSGKTLQASNNLELPEQLARSRAGRDLNLKRLPFTATEATGILGLVPQSSERTAAYGFDASYDWITSPRISQYRYVHLATHGFFDSDKPALSSIILSSFDAQGQDRKAYLRFPELFNLNLPTELVVLSACETGLGKDTPGEGLVGMTRGLMYAGALRVAVSLWSVDDQATSDLMQQFYTNLWQAKHSHAASLREAQLALWKQGKAPYYWAAFTLQGEWRN